MHALPHSGVNWANTARLFEDLGEEASSFTYEIYGFEASPLIAPFADAFFAWLNGDRVEEPESCLPRSGSTKDMARYAGAFGCGKEAWLAAKFQKHGNHTMHEVYNAKLRACMFKAVELPLSRLRPDPGLNSSELIAERLGQASRQACHPAVSEPPLNHKHSPKHRYTFIPAAAGAQDGWLRLYAPPHQLIRGGGTSVEMLPVLRPGLSAQRTQRSRSPCADLPAGCGESVVYDGRYEYVVRTVDVASWVLHSFGPRDYVLMKMDIEGGEHALLQAMIRNGAIRRVHTLSLECHGNTSECGHLHRHIKAAAPRLNLLAEGQARHESSRPWPVLGLSLACPWPVLGLSLARPWPVLGLSLARPWPEEAWGQESPEPACPSISHASS